MCKKTICLAAALAVGLSIPAGAELVGYWKLNEGTGTGFWDETDYWHDGTINPWDEATVRWTMAGYDSNALDFLSATSLTTVADAPLTAGLLDISEATCSFWMNMPAAYQAWGVMFDLLGTTADHSIEPDAAGGLGIGNAGGSGPWYWFQTTGVRLNDDQWHHVAVTYSRSANECIAYLDGRENASIAFGYGEPITTVRIGGPRYYSGVWRRYIGRLDEVAVYNQSLSAADVQRLFWYGPRWAQFASGPEPANGAMLATVNVTLRWTAGDGAAQHHVYVGPNAADVKNGAPEADQGTTATTSFSDYAWELGETYYWRVDEIETDGVTVHPGAVWSFTISARFASNPVPADGAVLVDPNGVLRWTAGAGAIFHSVYFGTDPAKLALVWMGPTPTSYDPPVLAFDTTYYWRVDEREGTKTWTGALWSFKTTPEIRIPDPNLVGFWNFDRDEKGVAIDWSGRGRHGRILGEPNAAAGYNLGAWAFDGVDDRIEIPQVVANATDLTLMAWIQAETPGAAGATARDGSGLLWSDAAGGGDHFTMAVLGRKLAFETGPGGNPNTISIRDVVTGEWTHVAVTRSEGTRQVQLFVNGAADATGDHTGDRNIGSCAQIVIGANTLDSRYFRGALDEVRAYNRVLSQSEIAALMRGNLLRAWNPGPAMGEVVDVGYAEPLSWSAGDDAARHDLYLGTDKTAVQGATPETAAVYKGRLDETTYGLAEPLAWDMIYYWRVDEVAGDGTVTSGNLWSFTVADYLVVDDFESYTDDHEAGEAIFQAWLDGWADPAYGGSQVGYADAPYGEPTIVHGGRQSMPLHYTNTDAAAYSEARRTWAAPQDWTVHGLERLVLYVRGQAENDPMRLYVTIGDAVGGSATVAHADTNVVQAAEWLPWSIPFSALAPVDVTQVETMVIGLGDRAQPAGGTGRIYLDDIQVRTGQE